MASHDPTFKPEFRAGDRMRTEIGEFEVQQVLGAGGMGVVYQVVRDERHGGRQFAIKTILPELLSRREVVERFEAEGRVLSKFDQENIVKIDGIFNMLSEPPRPFILMELLQGYTLRYVMEEYEEPFSVEDVCTVAIGVCNALEEIHKHNVVHRDIKPENIFIQKRRKRTRVVLIDFGIMKVILGSGAGNVTNFFLGSYSNASPEQLLGQEVTPRSDFYSLATCVYEMISGQPLFPELTDMRAVGQAHIMRKPVPLRERAPNVPKEIDEIVMRALEKDPTLRPKDAHAFRQPFTTVRNGILREEVPNAGHSTIERFLGNTVGAERLPVPVASVEPVKGQTLKLPVLDSGLRDTTAPSDPPCAGTLPDVRAELEAPSAALAIPALPAIVIAADAHEPDAPAWEPPSGLAAIPIQPPVALPTGPGTDQTSARDEPIAIPLAKSRAPSLLTLIAAAAAVLMVVVYLGRSVRSTGAAPTPAPTDTVQVEAVPNSEPSPTSPRITPAPSPSAAAAAAAVDVARSPVNAGPAAQPSSQPTAPTRRASHSSQHASSAPPRPDGSAARPGDVVNLFEDIKSAPAPSASAGKRMPGAGF